MTDATPKPKPGPAPRGRWSQALWHDLNRGDIHRSMRKDLKDLYHFYLDEEDRRKLRAMGSFKRGFVLGWWLLKGLVMNLSPGRRLLLVLSFLFLAFGDFNVTSGDVSVSLNVSLLSFALVLLILMLELKDKLLARDELEVGRAVQLSLLPAENPALEGWDIWLFTRPANDVGGDLVDYLPLEEGRLAVFLGDVAGKGLGAALLMAKLQSTLRALAPEGGGLPQLGARVNRILCRDGLPGRFATLAYLELVPGSGTIRLLNAGHIPPLRLVAGSVDTFAPVAPPLGVLPEASYVEQTLEVPPGATLLVYSDGLTDSQNEYGDFFDETRLQSLLATLGGEPAEAAGRRLLGAADIFRGEQAPFDDLSLIVLRRAEAAGVTGG